MILMEQVAETVIVEQRVRMNYNEQICRGAILSILLHLYTVMLTTLYYMVSTSMVSFLWDCHCVPRRLFLFPPHQMCTVPQDVLNLTALSIL